MIVVSLSIYLLLFTPRSTHARSHGQNFDPEPLDGIFSESECSHFFYRLEYKPSYFHTRVRSSSQEAVAPIIQISFRRRLHRATALEQGAQNGGMDSPLELLKKHHEHHHSRNNSSRGSSGWSRARKDNRSRSRGGALECPEVECRVREKAASVRILGLVPHCIFVYIINRIQPQTHVYVCVILLTYHLARRLRNTPATYVLFLVTLVSETSLKACSYTLFIAHYHRARRLPITLTTCLLLFVVRVLLHEGAQPR